MSEMMNLVELNGKSSEPIMLILEAHPDEASRRQSIQLEILSVVFNELPIRVDYFSVAKRNSRFNWRKSNGPQCFPTITEPIGRTSVPLLHVRLQFNHTKKHNSRINGF